MALKRTVFCSYCGRVSDRGCIAKCRKCSGLNGLRASSMHELETLITNSTKTPDEEQQALDDLAALRRDAELWRQVKRLEESCRIDIVFGDYFLAGYKHNRLTDCDAGESVYCLGLEDIAECLAKIEEETDGNA